MVGTKFRQYHTIVNSEGLYVSGTTGRQGKVNKLKNRKRMIKKDSRG